MIIYILLDSEMYVFVTYCVVFSQYSEKCWQEMIDYICEFEYKAAFNTIMAT